MKFTVILPVYNRADSLGPAIDSVLAQTHPAHEVIILDDGSQDDLSPALTPYEGQIRVIRQDNAGVATARNTAASAATGDWLTFQDSDDLWTPDHLEIAARDLAQAPANVVAHLGDVIYTGDGYAESLFDIKSRTFPMDTADLIDDPLPLVISGMTLQGAAIRKDVFEKLGGFDTGMRMLSDTAFFCQLALEGPFLVTGHPVAEIRRLEGDENAITSLHRKNAVFARQMHVRGLTALADRTDLNSEQRRLADSILSGAEFRLAQVLHNSDKPQARRYLWQAAQRHPNKAKGWIKSLMAAALGAQGYKMAISENTLDRS